METGFTVGQIMKKYVLTMPPSSKIIDVAKCMVEKRVGSILITENNKILGIVTDQDMTRKVVARSLNVAATAVSEVMTTEVWTIAPDIDINKAVEALAKHKVRHLPVAYGDTLLGMVSYRDIIRIQPSLVELICTKQSLAEDIAETLLH